MLAGADLQGRSTCLTRSSMSGEVCWAQRSPINCLYMQCVRWAGNQWRGLSSKPTLLAEQLPSSPEAVLDASVAPSTVAAFLLPTVFCSSWTQLQQDSLLWHSTPDGVAVLLTSVMSPLLFTTGTPEIRSKTVFRESRRVSGVTHLICLAITPSRVLPGAASVLNCKSGAGRQSASSQRKRYYLWAPADSDCP